VPRPILLQGHLKGIIDQNTSETIPLVNLLDTNQACSVKLCRISQQTFEESHEQLGSESPPSEDGEWEFRLESGESTLLKPKETRKLQLAYLPTTLRESYCQVRVRFEHTKQLIIYNFRGLPELPSTRHPLLEVGCQAEKETAFCIKIPNKLRESMRL
jgi:hypothetical protein